MSGKDKGRLVSVSSSLAWLIQQVPDQLNTHGQTHHRNKIFLVVLEYIHFSRFFKNIFEGKKADFKINKIDLCLWTVM